MSVRSTALAASRSGLPIARVLTVAATVLLLASILTFSLNVLSDSNPAAALLGDHPKPSDIDRIEHEFGLDRPVWMQYLSWLWEALHGDLGTSWFTGIPVSESIGAALPVDLSIAGLAIVLAVLIGGTAGIGAALDNGGVVDRSVTLVCSFLATLPPFVIGMVLIIVFSLQLGVLPTGGYVPLTVDPVEWLRFAILPSLALSLDTAAAIARQLRTSLVGSLRENYVTGAEMRGFSHRRVMFGHVLRNSVAPAMAVLGLAIPVIVGGAVVTEKLFSLPGIAQLALDAAEQGDVPVILGTLMVTVVVVLVASMLVNAAQTALNPAARRQSRVRPTRGRLTAVRGGATR